MKKLKDTKLGQFLKEKFPQLLDTVGDLLPDKGVLGIVKRGIDLVGIDPKDQEVFVKLYLEADKEYYEMELQDRKDARSREIEMAKTGKTDHLMYVTGYTALASFLLMVGAVIIEAEAMKANPLFHQLMGIIEGVALTVFGYYFGTSKSSKDKDTIMGAQRQRP